MSDVQKVSSGSEFESKIGYSRAIIDDQYIFVSGTTGYDYESMSISDNAVEQAEQCFKNIEFALRQGNCTFDQVVRIRYIFPDRADFEPCWPVFRNYIGHVKPAATVIIADLVDEKMKLEVEVTARRLLTDD